MSGRDRTWARPLLGRWWVLPAILAALVALAVGSLVVDALARAAYDAARHGDWKG